MKWNQNKYHAAGTDLKSNRKSQKEAGSMTLTHKYMTVHFPGLDTSIDCVGAQL